jgi:hypothetical protein
MELEARLAYEAIAGRCSDNHWYRVKRLLKKHNLPVSVANAQFFAEIRALIPRSAIGVEGILECYSRAEVILSQSNRAFEGAEILKMLSSYGVKPHQTTISRWFRPLGGYRKHKQYPAQKLKSIFTQAFIYKANFTPALPEEKTHAEVC